MSAPYPKYKESGFGWLGRIPTHWEVQRLKQNLQLLTEKTECRSNPVALENIESWSGRFVETEIQYEGNGIAFKRGDILFGKLRPYLAKAMLAEKDGEAIGDFHVMRPRSKVFNRYALYQILNRDFISIVDGAAFGAKMPRVNWDFMANMVLTTPPFDEQKKIADFLDHETAKIDALVDEQRRLIDLLKEKRQAVISHAVTKGLNPNAPMKDSGIEWLGKVPEHWNLIRLKQISPSLTVGIVVNPSSYVADDGVPFIYGGDIREERIDWTNSRRISRADSDANSKTRLSEGDILTVRVGAPGVSAVVPKECEGGNCASVMLIRKGNYCSEWLCFAMNSRIVRFQVEVVQYGAAQEQFNIAHATEFLVPVPPRAEQQEIANALLKDIDRLDKLTDQTEQAIKVLEERRTALISAAVTGKIDVRNFTGTETEAA